MANWSYGTTDR